MFLLFLVYAVLEVILTWKAWEVLPWWKFLLMVFGTGIVGLSMLKHETLRAFREGFSRARSAGDFSAAVFDGLLVGIAGVWLILPGVLGDVLGLLLLIGPLRRFLSRRLAASGRFRAFGLGGSSAPRPSSRDPWSAPTASSPAMAEVIDIEGTEIRETPEAPPALPGERSHP